MQITKEELLFDTLTQPQAIQLAISNGKTKERLFTHFGNCEEYDSIALLHWLKLL